MAMVAKASEEEFWKTAQPGKRYIANFDNLPVWVDRMVLWPVFGAESLKSQYQTLVSIVHMTPVEEVLY